MTVFFSPPNTLSTIFSPSAASTLAISTDPSPSTRLGSCLFNAPSSAEAPSGRVALACNPPSSVGSAACTAVRAVASSTPSWFAIWATGTLESSSSKEVIGSACLEVSHEYARDRLTVEESPLAIPCFMVAVIVPGPVRPAPRAGAAAGRPRRREQAPGARAPVRRAPTRARTWDLRIKSPFVALVSEPQDTSQQERHFRTSEQHICLSLTSDTDALIRRACATVCPTP